MTTQTDRAAMQMALDALGPVKGDSICNEAHHSKKDRHESHEACPVVDRIDKAIAALRAALAQPSEPVLSSLTSD
ncbi:MAG: hypothetical protein JJD98_00275 [Polaromonas sp.]|nr:hypothetical protein [Polaromonas sp.]